MSEIRNLEKQFRDLELDRASVDAEARTVALSFSSEHPVDRIFGREVLDHSDSSVDLGRFRSGAAVVVNHDIDDQVGVVESANIADRRGRAVVRFGKSNRAQEVFADVQDGIRRHVSIGYRIHRLERDKDAEEETYRATRWEPLELSIVAVPADPTIGVGRSQLDGETNPCEVVDTMKDETRQETPEQQPGKVETKVENVTEPVRAEPGISVKDRDEYARSAVDEFRQKAARMRAIGKEYGQEDLADEYLETGRSIDELNAELLKRMKPAKSGSLGMEVKEVKRYSFLRALNAMANPTSKEAQQAAAFEIEVSSAAAERNGKSPRGMIVPFDVLSHRDLNTGTPTEGSELVGTDHLAASFIDMLRNRAATVALGARVMTDLVGNVSIPKQAGPGTAYWVAEGSPVTESQLTTGQVLMSPKTLGAWTDISRKLLIQGTPDAEMLVRDDFARVIALEVDRAALYGTGANSQPLGISGQTGVNTLTLAAAGAPTWAEVVEMETLVAADNADIGTLAYLTDAGGRGSMKSTSKDTGSGMMLWDGDEVNGYRAMASNQVVANDFWFGNWNDLLIGMWSGIDFVVDPYSNAPSGTVRVTAHQDVDIAVRHGESFTLANGGV